QLWRLTYAVSQGPAPTALMSVPAWILLGDRAPLGQHRASDRRCRMSIVAISETAGSLGNEIGRRLAERLNYRFADREIIAKTAERFGENDSGVRRACGDGGRPGQRDRPPAGRKAQLSVRRSGDHRQNGRAVR